MSPVNPLQAVTHQNPYPYYATLRAGPALQRDSGLGLWVAASAAAVTEILASPDFLVRPRVEPVPRPIAGTPAGEVFARLVRMNDGERHGRGKQVLHRALAKTKPHEIAQIAARIAAREWRDGCRHWSDWSFRLALCTLAALMGFTEDEQRQIAGQVRDFVACLSPLASEAELKAASDAAGALRRMFAEKVAAGKTAPDGLLATVLKEADAAGWSDADSLVANLVGLFSQTCDATAGWIGNSIVALLNQPQVLQTLLLSPAMLEAFVDEVARFDPAIQNTRRFAARRTRVADLALEEGECVLVLLAAANRDPAANALPDAFRIERPDRRTFGFGHGTHQCPGQALARAITMGALHQFLRAGSSETGKLCWTYRSSLNARMPEFECNEES